MALKLVDEKGIHPGLIYGGSKDIDRREQVWSVEFVKANTDWILLPDSTDFELDSYTPFSIAFWLRPTQGVLANQIPLCKGGSEAASAYEWQLKIENDKLYATMFTTGGSIIRREEAPILNDVWAHWVIIFTGTAWTDEIKMYRNTVKSNSHTSSANLSYTAGGQGVSIGRGYGGGTWRYLDGIIDDLRFFHADISLYNNIERIYQTGIGNDKQCVLLIQSDERHGTATFTDSGYGPNCPHTVSATVGDPIHSTGQSRFCDTSIHFDGNDAIDWGTGSGDWDFGLGDFTVEMWIYTTTVSNYSVLIGRPATNEWWLGLHGNPTGYLGCYIPEVGSIQLGTIQVNDGKWHHIAFTRYNGIMRTFVDGIKDLEQDWSAYTIDNVANTLRLGHDNSSNAYYIGYMDQVAIYKGISRYFESGFNPWEDPYDEYICESVVLLIHSENTDAENDFWDASPSDENHDPQAQGYVQHDDSTSKFGNSSIVFVPASNDYLTVPNSTEFDFGSDDFTIEFFIRRNATGSQQTVINNWTPGGTPYSGGFSLELTTSGYIYFYWDYGPDLHSITSTGTITDTSTWHHVAVVREGSSISIYIDGSRDNTAAISDTIDTTSSDLYIGRYSTGTAELSANLDEVRIKLFAEYSGTTYTVPTRPFGNFRVVESCPQWSWGVDKCTGGSASASSEYSGSYVAAYAFDDNTGTRWAAASGFYTNSWVQYDFGSGNAYAIQRMLIRAHNDGTRNTIRNFKVYGSNDASRFDLLLKAKYPEYVLGQNIEYCFGNITEYRYMRIYVIDEWSGTSGISITEMSMYECQPTTTTTTSTSTTTSTTTTTTTTT